MSIDSQTTFDGPVTIRHVRFANPESGWAVLDAAGADGAPVALVGPLVHLEPGERARIVGQWVTDSRFGRQVKVTQASPLTPDDPDAIVAYLKRVKHIGSRRAERLVECFGVEDLFEVIDADPAAAFAAVGLRTGRAQAAAASWQALRVTRRLHLLLAPHGLAYLAGRIHEHLGDDAHELLLANPYELTSVFGVGFAIADRIAHAGGREVAADERERAAVMYVLAEAERGGSTCMPVDELLSACERLTDDPVPKRIVSGLVSDRRLVREDEWVYRAATAALEAELSAQVAELIAAAPSRRLSPEGADEAVAVAPGGELTEQQRAAVAAALAHRLSVITGGPGTGKTASIKSIAAAAEARGAKVMLVAPTGRAAVRMTQAGASRASTVHSALQWIPGEGPARDRHDPLPCDLLIVDETSMANLELLVMLLRAVGGDTHVVLVGDADQLAPVGAGKPFAELVASKRVPTTRLTHIFRQAAGSMIVQGAHAIRRGSPPEFVAGDGMRRDLFMIERPAAPAALAEIVSLVSERLPDHYDVDPVRDIQVFAPVYRGELGIDAINAALRAALNPDGRPVRGGRLRIGDKLMMTGRNLHELGLMNGTLLRLLDEVAGGEDDDEDADNWDGAQRSAGRPRRDDPALLLAADDAVFRLAPEDSDSLRLAYACSVHRGQGIELPIAVIVAHPACGAFFLRREMLYTAVTRATVATVIVGTRAVVARAVATADTGRRHGRLGARLARSRSG
ncbi:MAG TPA: AAA family ATPase [Solirubrobacteraceae bacterium]|nr:AAA family ATPase [Solirubrobacteraceae bacterium]